MPVEFKKISSAQLEMLPRQKTVFFFPVGSLEDHGPHLPMGLDLAESNQLCYLTAQSMEEKMSGWVGVIMPEAPLGIDSDTTYLSIRVRPYILRDWLIDACKGLIRVGFFQFVCFSGNLSPKQLTAIEEAGKKVTRIGFWRRLSPTFLSASSSMVSFKDVLASPFWPDPEEHGGARDTSIALALVGDQVDSNYQTLPTQKKAPSRWKRNFRRRTRRLKSYWGTPSSATAAEGERIMIENLENVFPKLRAVWEGAPPRSVFRTWYSILPANKSTLKAWLLVISIIGFLALWGYVTSFGLNMG